MTPNCERLRYKESLFYRDNAGIFQPMSNPANLVVRAIDDSLSFAVGADGNVYRYDNTSSTFVVTYSPAMAFPSSSWVHVYQNRVIIDSWSQ